MPHLDGFFFFFKAATVGATLELAEALTLHHHPLFTFVPTAPRTKGVCRGGEGVLNGPRIPVCSFCYPLKSQTMGTGWTKGKHGCVAQIFSLCRSHFLFFSFFFFIELPKE